MWWEEVRDGIRTKERRRGGLKREGGRRREREGRQRVLQSEKDTCCHRDKLLHKWTTLSEDAETQAFSSTTRTYAHHQCRVLVSATSVPRPQVPVPSCKQPLGAADAPPEI